MDPSAPKFCRHLDWDTQFFGVPIAQVTAPIVSIESAEATLEWCRTQKISCLYYLIPCGEVQSISLAEKFNFHLVDVRLTFELNEIGNLPPQAFAHIRPAQEKDIPALREIARLAYNNTRFFNDGNFPKNLCEELYMTWIEKSCQGYAEIVWVVSPGDEPGGFISCHLENRAGQIGLLGVHPAYQHQGWGDRLVKTSLKWFAERNCSSVKVVTQGNNHAAQKLYQQCGFSLASIDLWYHRWFDPVVEEG